jgi:tetratricopeptide (TPR) repeat protein
MKELKNDHLENLFSALEVKDKKRKRYYFVVTFLLIAIGLFLAYWTSHQSQEIYSKDYLIKSLHDTVTVKQTKLDTVKLKQINIQKSIEQVNIGSMHASRGRFKEAFIAYNKAIELDSTNSGAYALKGYLLLRSGDKKNALANLEHAVELDSTLNWHHYNLSLAYWDNGLKEEAINQLRIIFSKDSSFRKIVSDDRQFMKFKASNEFNLLMEEN